MRLQGSLIKRKNCDRKILFLAFALVMSLSYSACSTDNSTIDSASPTISNAISTEQADRMKINIKVEDKVVTATLNDSKTTQDFTSLLPLTLMLEDYVRTEKISNLPKKLSTEDAPSGSDPAVGDIAYYAPWGNLAIFYQDSGYANGLVILGKIDGGIEALNVPGSAQVTIELAQ